VSLKAGVSDKDAVRALSDRGVGLAPLVDGKGRVIGLYPDVLGVAAPRDNLVVLMAGGRGARLFPLTQNCPKPMLKVAGRPLLQTIIERLQAQGFRRFRLAVNYLAEMIEDHFGDGSSLGVEIDYLREDHPRGTAGALSLLTDRIDQPMLVMNGDLLTRMSFGELIDFHVEHQAKATLCVREHAFQSPHGVVETDGPRLTSPDGKADLPLAGQCGRLLPVARGVGAGSGRRDVRHARPVQRPERGRGDGRRLSDPRILARHRPPARLRERPGGVHRHLRSGGVGVSQRPPLTSANSLTLH
jgi:GTP:adenosylcobinamide-phosphate guanylyltransferase